MRTWRPRLMLALAAIALLFFAACASGDSDSEAFGFLQIPTRTPAPTSTPITEHDRYDICPDLPRELCILAGDVVNIYQALSLSRVTAINVVHDRMDWILDGDVQPVLRMLDVPAKVRSGTASQRPFFAIVPIWDRGQGIPSYPHFDETGDAMTLLIDLDARVMSLSFQSELVAPIPDGFIADIRSSFAGVTPTSSPAPASTRIPYTPGPTRTPLLVPEGAPFFDHPEEELRWDGPDDRVSSREILGFCEAPDELQEPFGIPALIAVDDDDEPGFWATGAVPRPPALRWTGYHHDGWEIWQGENPKTIYLLNPRLDDIVFEYWSFGCF